MLFNIQSKNMKPSAWIEINYNAVSAIAEKFQQTEKSLKEDVTTLTNWMKIQYHLPEILDDKSLQNFLFLNKCSVEKAKQKIDMYYTLRSQIPDIFDSINPNCAKMKEAMKITRFVILPKMTDNLCRIWLYKFCNKHLTDQLEPKYIITSSIMLQEMRLKEDLMYGDVIIFDADGLKLDFLLKLIPTFAKKMFDVYEKMFSIRMKKFYIVNSPSFITVGLAVAKNILKPKLFDRIIVCQDTSILLKCIPKRCLPRDYGGEERSVEELFDTLKTKLNQYKNRFDELDGLRVNENLRPKKLENNETLGFYGNFKNLSID